MIKINYKVNGKDRYIKGNKIKEDEHFIYVKAIYTDRVYTINKNYIIDMTDLGD